MLLGRLIAVNRIDTQGLVLLVLQSVNDYLDGGERVDYIQRILFLAPLLGMNLPMTGV